MKPVWLTGAGVLGPGLPDWSATREILLGRARYADAPDPEPVPALLPANERRRASIPARWALMVGSEALAGSGLGLEEVAIVFTSCGGDGMITDQICQALAASPPGMSPTRFHNSVHNAPAGYWSIFARSRAPSTTLCGFDASFAAALLLAPVPAGNRAMRLAIELADGPASSVWPEILPSDLSANPTAQALLLLAAAAKSGGGRAELQYLQKSHVTVEISP